MRTLIEATEAAAAFGDFMRKVTTAADQAKPGPEYRPYESRAARRAREREERRAAKRQKASTR